MTGQLSYVPNVAASCTKEMEKESSYLCEESQGVVGTLGSHLSDQVLGAIFQQLLLNGVPTLQPGQETHNKSRAWTKSFNVRV